MDISNKVSGSFLALLRWRIGLVCFVYKISTYIIPPYALYPLSLLESSDNCTWDGNGLCLWTRKPSLRLCWLHVQLLTQSSTFYMACFAQ